MDYAQKKRLIIHCDDLGLSHSVNQAAFFAFERGSITSASVMTPCPGFSEAAAYASRRPNLDVGIHLTLTSEWPGYRWGPVAPRDSVPGLVDPDGYLWSDALAVVKHAKPHEVAIELAAQVERALAFGLNPTHVDTHMMVLLINAELLSAYVDVSRRFQLPLVLPTKKHISLQGLAFMKKDEFHLDEYFSANESWEEHRWFEQYVSCVKKLEPGVSQMTVHLAMDDPEMRELERGRKKKSWGSAWRQRDLDVVTSPEFKAELEKADIQTMSWRDLHPCRADREAALADI
jgi:predicted glycoside hydrolase/deacetylase ChbG (UPF0249 family)